jgi:hypothetical protein
MNLLADITCFDVFGHRQVVYATSRAPIIELSKYFGLLEHRSSYLTSSHYAYAYGALS